MSWYIHPSKQLRDDELPPELVVTNRDGSIEQAYVPETRLYSLEERATCNAHAIKRLKDENTKLRELVADMWRGMCSSYSRNCFACKHYPRAASPNCECEFRTRMRELGIEVDE